MAAIPPCLGTALIIWANSRKDANVATVVGALLAIRPVVFIGLISYSLYLWHWTFFAYQKYITYHPTAENHKFTLVVAGFVCAVLSWKYVETPFRTRRLGRIRSSVFGYACAGLAAVLVAGVVTMRNAGFPNRFPEKALTYARAKDDRTYINDIRTSDVAVGDLSEIGASSTDRSPSLLVWGDSYAMAIVPALDVMLKENGMSGVVATHSSTAPVLDWYKQEKFGLNQEAPAFNQAVLEYIKKYRVKHVVMSCRWVGYTPSSIGGSNAQDNGLLFHDAVVSTVRELTQCGVRTWVILDVPNHTIDVPKTLSRSFISSMDISDLCASPSSWKGLEELDPDLLTSIQQAGGVVLDPKPSFLDEQGGHYVVKHNHVALYCDTQHLTTEGAKLIMLPFFREMLKIKE